MCESQNEQNAGACASNNMQQCEIVHAHWELRDSLASFFPQIE